MGTDSITDLSDADLTARDFRPGAVHHVVLFRLAAGCTQDDAQEVERRFRALADAPHPDGSGPYIRSIAAGGQTSHEGASHGFELGFVVLFASEGDRNTYVGEPLISDPALVDREHAAFKDFVGPLLAAGPDGVLVFDFTDGGATPASRP
ncbi:hypothetical protein AS850_03885 [Frondihabitans sp. 762G35]|uniref:Dabb family protein n=1 Tax=Frondihabitans sp. 762G35 TaxID=1446794 RepID=UPI000D224B7F|nr:Dabb family protein [Frondihabitans sp. 762G35]ARC56214.1 hypothetical protein AS850_03885 [Frondihabitans sp. 762G35]